MALTVAAMIALQLAVVLALFRTADHPNISAATLAVVCAMVAAAGGIGAYRSSTGRAAAPPFADERLLLALESAGKVAWDWDIATGRDLWVGDLKTMFGIEGQHFAGRVEDFHRRLHPDDRATVAAAVAESRSNRTPYRATFRIIRPDGTMRWVNATGAFRYDSNGTPTRMLGVATDITEQAKHEEALREREAQFRAIADDAPAFLWLASIDGCCTYVSRSWLDFTGWEDRNDIGTGWCKSVHPQDLPEAVQVHAEAVGKRQPFRLEYRLRRRDGVYRWLLDSGVPRYAADGSFAGYIGSSVDVTELKTARRALSSLSQRLMEAQESERARIAAELDDDVGQSVVVLTMELDTLLKILPHEPERIEQRADDVRARAGDLIRRVHALSRRLHNSRLGLLGITAAAAGYCQDFGNQQNVTVDFAGDVLQDDLSGDAARALYRVLQEALANAFQHSGAGHFQVSLLRHDDGVELEVVDRGRGFDSAEVLSGPGTGLVGMRERLRVVGGDIAIESPRGTGTTIRARVPFTPTLNHAEAAWAESSGSERYRA